MGGGWGAGNHHPEGAHQRRSWRVLQPRRQTPCLGGCERRHSDHLGSDTGKPLTTPFPFSSPSLHSPDGRLFALVNGSVFCLHRLPSGKSDELAPYRWWIAPDYRWHAAQAQESWQASDWFAAAFHLGRLLPQHPWDAELQARHAYALYRLGRAGAAATHFLHAVLLDPHLSPWPFDGDAGHRAKVAAESEDWPRAVADFELARDSPPPLSPSGPTCCWPGAPPGPRGSGGVAANSLIASRETPGWRSNWCCAVWLFPVTRPTPGALSGWPNTSSLEVAARPL